MVHVVDDRDRYVIQKYFEKFDRTAAGPAGRSRASRISVRRFIEGAVRLAIREQSEALKKQQRRVAARLADPERAKVSRTRELSVPDERQMDLLNEGAGR